jgi:hypothetical protein
VDIVAISVIINVVLFLSCVLFLLKVIMTHGPKYKKYCSGESLGHR